MVGGIAIFGPIVEEITYRGLLFNTVVERGSARAAILITAAVFSLVHLVGLDPGDAEGLGQITLTFIPPLVALFVVGLVLAIVRSRTGSLSAPIFLHGGFNLIQVLLLLFLPDAAS
jgi:membrane protease YdiL (CAAX protease family)